MDDIKTWVAKIHQDFGQDCLVFKYKNVCTEERFALWSACDVYLNTCLRDGLCLQPLEFVYIKKLTDKFANSCCILSEFQGNSRTVGGVLMTNPYDAEDIVSKIREAVLMPEQLRVQRMLETYHYAMNHSTLSWCFNFLNQLKSYKRGNLEGKYEQYGMGHKWQFIKQHSKYKELNVSLLQEVYNRKDQRLILIDEDGVIACDHSSVDDQYLNALNQLSEDRKNIVMLVSASRKEEMHAKYATMAPHVGLAAENGFFWRWNSFGKTDQDWEHLFDRAADCSWIKPIRELMKTSTRNVQGSYIEQGESNVIWNFKDCNYAQGNLEGRQLRSNILKIFGDYPIRITQNTESFVQVRYHEHRRDRLFRTLIKRELSKQFPGIEVDFILYVGASLTVEKNHKLLNEVAKKIEGGTRARKSW